MPVIEVYKQDLENLLGKPITIDELNDIISFVKGEIDDVDGDIIKIELKDINRPDLWSVEGIVRELRGIFNVDKGIPKYNVRKSENYQIYVDKEVIEVRPYIIGAVVKNVKMNKYVLESLIQLQEKIMLSFGRNRKRLAIGTHNLDLIEFPVKYTIGNGNERFIPLYENEEMSLKEILEKTPTGKKYKHLLKNKYPLLIDNKGDIISFPPIINSNTIGRLTTNSNNIFIDITGNDLEAMKIALNILVTALADRGGEIYSVKILHPEGVLETPEIDIIKKEFDYLKVKKYLGVSLNDEEIIDLLNKKRMNAQIKENRVIVEYLNYRYDLYSEQDLVEDILIAYGYNKIPLSTPKFYTKGGLTEYRRFIRKLKQFMIGLGAIEVYTPTLVPESIEDIIDFIKREEKIKLLNPVSKNYNTVRSTILSSVLNIIKDNTDVELPLEIFEIGRVGYNKFKEKTNLLYLYMDSGVSFNDVKSILLALQEYLNIEDIKLKDSSYGFLIKGRQADIIYDNEVIGYIGEIHPKVLESLGIRTPMAVLEISIDKFIK